MSRKLTIKQEKWKLAQTFTISRGSKTEAEIVVVELEENGKIGRGECVPYARYKESVPGVIETIQGFRGLIEGGGGRARIRSLMQPGAARNAVDCAVWDLEAKLSGKRAWEMAELEPPHDVITALHAQPGHAREDGGGGERECRASASEAEACRPGRSRTGQGRPSSRAERGADRRCQ